MGRDLMSPVGILDATHPAAARAAAPWLGVYWLCLIPFRLAQVHFARELALLGTSAPDYLDYLTGLAWGVFAAFLPAVYGRAVWVRACGLTLQSGTGVGAEALRVPPAALASSFYLALLTEALFCLTAWMFITLPLLAILTGVVCVAAQEVERPGLFRPIAAAGRLLARPGILISLAFTYTVALVIAYFNVYAAFVGGLWAAQAVGGDRLARWNHLLRPGSFVLVPAEPLAACLYVAGAILIVEPFWLASLTVYAHRTQWRRTGDDLRLAFRTLTEGR